jgi:hypothetical protein
MVAAQSILALPIVTALAHRAAEDLWAEYGDALQVFGASKSRAVHRWVFLDLRRSSKEVPVLELQNYRYDVVMVEVDDVARALEMIP